MRYVVPFSEASDRAIVGGKGFGLHRLTSWDLNVPPGSVVRTAAYDEAMTSIGIGVNDPGLSASDVSAAILSFDPNEQLVDEIDQLWTEMSRMHGVDLRVSCRSSATAEDSATASFAGQFATVLGVRESDGVIEAIKQCWASVWSDEAVAYRESNGISHAEVSMAVVVQKMVNASCSGVAFSINPVTSDSGEVMINSNWGLGETVVSGMVTPDTFLVSRTDNSISFRDISQAKTIKHVVGADGAVEEVAAGPLEVMSPSLTDEQIVEVAKTAVMAEEEAGIPQDIEWAYEGDELFVLQTRPITTV